jgi:hypothetical protein
VFDPKSRYAKQPLYPVKDHRGRDVYVVAVPPQPAERVAGYHLRKQGERLDLLAAQYLKNSAGFWRIAEASHAMLPESLTLARQITIPGGK